jgi:hypothetical protein
MIISASPWDKVVDFVNGRDKDASAYIHTEFVSILFHVDGFGNLLPR